MGTPLHIHMHVDTHTHLHSWLHMGMHARQYKGFCFSPGPVRAALLTNDDSECTVHSFTPLSNVPLYMNFYRTVKHTWSELGVQLTTLAKLHAGKAQAYLETVRRPLLDLAPRLEETRKEVQCHISLSVLSAWCE